MKDFAIELLSWAILFCVAGTALFVGVLCIPYVIISAIWGDRAEQTRQRHHTPEKAVADVLHQHWPGGPWTVTSYTPQARQGWTVSYEKEKP